MTSRRGRPPHPDVLTPAEWDVLNAIRQGLSNRMIARGRGSSLDGVKYHIDNIKRKLGVDERARLRHVAVRPAMSALAAQQGDAMSANELSLGTIGQIALTVSRLPEAEAFYRDVLGLQHLYSFGNLAFFDCDGLRLYITASDDDMHSRQHSTIYFRVPDIEAAYAALGGRGVAFEGAPHMIHRHEDGMEEWMAFFKDPDGNILAIMSQVKAA